MTKGILTNGRFELKFIKEKNNYVMLERVNQSEDYYKYRYIVARNIKYKDNNKCCWEQGYYDLTQEDAIGLLDSK